MAVTGNNTASLTIIDTYTNIQTVLAGLVYNAGSIVGTGSITITYTNQIGAHNSISVSVIDGAIVPVPTTVSTQQALYSHFHPTADIVTGPPLQDDGSTDFTITYYGNNFPGGPLATVVANSDYYNSHDYPTTGAPSTNLARVTSAVAADFNNKPGVITEFNPTRLNNTSDEVTGAYYTICGLLAAKKFYDIRAFIWYALYDYQGETQPIGLFAGVDPTAPRTAAKFIRNLFSLCKDVSPTRHSFSPGTLDYTINGLPATWNNTGGGQHALFEDSNGFFYLFIWNEQSALATSTTTPISVLFNSGAVSQIRDFSITNNAVADTPTLIQSVSNVSSLTMNLTTEVRVLIINSGVATSTVSIIGVASSAVVHTLTATKSPSPGIAGRFATGAIGTVTPFIAGNPHANGVFATGAVGSFSMGGQLATIQPPLGVQLGPSVGAGAGTYASTSAHWTGFNSAMGRPATVVSAIGGAATPAANPSTWAGGDVANFASAGIPTTVIPLLTWTFNDGTIDTNFAVYADGANQVFGGSSYDFWITHSLGLWHSAGFNSLYIRINWEFSENLNNFGVQSDANIPTWISAWKHFCNLCHTYASNNSMTIKMVWCPQTSWQNGVLLSGTTRSAHPVTDFFPVSDANAVGGKYIDVVGPDLYAYQYVNSYTVSVAAASPANTYQYLSNWVSVAQANNCTFGLSALADGGSGATPAFSANSFWIPNNLVPYLNTLRTLTPPVSIEYIVLVDSTVSGSTQQFTNGGNAGDLTAWKTVIGGPQNVGSILTSLPGGGSGTESAEGKTVSVVAGNSTSTITDATGAVWSVAGGIALQNGVSPATSSNVVELYYHNHQVYFANTSFSWMVWNGAWTPSNDPRNVAQTESLNPTLTLITPGSGIFYDRFLVGWSISSGGAMKADDLDSLLANTTNASYYGHTTFATNNVSTFHWNRASPGWVFNATSAAGSEITIDANGTGNTYLIDSSGNIWSAYLNQIYFGTTSIIQPAEDTNFLAELYWDGTFIWHMNTRFQWIWWNGTWFNGLDPRRVGSVESADGSTITAGSGSFLDSNLTQFTITAAGVMMADDYVITVPGLPTATTGFYHGHQVYFGSGSTWFFFNTSTFAWTATTNPLGTGTATTLSRMTLSNAAIVSGTSGVVGNLSTAMNNGTFTGTYAVTHGHNASSFQIVNGNQLATTAALAAGTYDVTVTATQPGIKNSPLAHHFMVIANASGTGTIIDITISNLTIAGNLATGTPVGNISVLMSSGTFTGTLTATGSNEVSGRNGQPGFTIVGSQLRTVGVVPPGRYGVGIKAVQAGVPNSPFGVYVSVNVTGVTPFWTTPPAQAAAVGYNTLTFADDFIFSSISTAQNQNTTFNWYNPPAFPGGSIAPFANVHTTWFAGDANMTGPWPPGGAPNGGANASPAGGIVTFTGGNNNATITSSNINAYSNIGSWFPNPEDGIFRKFYVEFYYQFNNTNFTGAMAAIGWPALWSWSYEAYYDDGAYPQPIVNAFQHDAGGHAECDYFEWRQAGPGFGAFGNIGTPGLGSNKPLGGVGFNSPDNAWHTVGYLWTENTASVYYDNVLLGTTVGLNALYETSHHQLIFMGVGLNWVAAGQIPLNVDWVRVWVAP